MVDKEQVYLACLRRVEEMIQTAQHSLNQAEEAAQSEIKSSAGDKFETGRAMMHAEMHKAKRHMGEAKTLLMDLKSMKLKSNYETVEKGSYIITDTAHYFICVGLGKIKTENASCFAISPASPIAKAMIGKAVNEDFHFNDKRFTIASIH